MNIKQATSHIESHEFAVRVNIASDLRTFLRSAQQDKAVLWLRECLDTYEIRLEILSRIYELSKYRIDLRYENQWDTALAVYLWLLNTKDPIIAKIAAELTNQIPQCWWAVKLSRSILFEKKLYSDTKDNVVSKDNIVSEIIATRMSISFKHDVGEAQIYASLLAAIDQIYRHKYNFIIKTKNPNDSVSNKNLETGTDYVAHQLSDRTDYSEKVSQL